MTSTPQLPGARPGPSSYWSVVEQGDFQKCVAYFGTDWVAIASYMGTKTQTMVKNQYLRLVEGGAQELERMAEEADERRNKGVDLGPPPDLSPMPPRRYGRDDYPNVPSHTGY
jgi:serine/arginine repetitive matrix protein 2